MYLSWIGKLKKNHQRLTHGDFKGNNLIISIVICTWLQLQHLFQLWQNDEECIMQRKLLCTPNTTILVLSFPENANSIHILIIVATSTNYAYWISTWIITKTHLFKYTENFTTKKGKLSDKKSDIFHISAKNIDCGYSLEPPRRGGSNEYPQFMYFQQNKKNNIYPCKPQFYYIKGAFKGSKLYWRVFVMWSQCLNIDSVSESRVFER